MAVVVLVWHFLSWRWVLKNMPPGLTEGIVLFTGLAAASCVSYILGQSQHPDSQYYHVGLMVFLTYGNIVQRLWFRYAVVFSLIILAMHVVGVQMVPAFNERLVLPAMSLVAATAVFTLMANYAMEYDERQRYMLSRRRLRLMAELADAQRRLHELSRVDPLTGLANRRHFQEHMHQVWQRAAHDGREVAIIMLDVDHFKRYNDRYGHPAGDRCLAQVAQAIQPCLRGPHDLIARYGGEEFIAVLHQADLDAATQVAQRIRQAVADQGIPHEASPTAGTVTVSVGVACCKAGPAHNDAALLAAADAALYAAKHAGRNTVATA